MDAKSKANFINSVAAGTNIPCPKCGASNKADSKFCISCGEEIVVPQANNAPAFAPTKETPAKGRNMLHPAVLLQRAFLRGASNRPR